MLPKERVSINETLAAALLELDTRTSPNAVERPTPAIKAAVEALLADTRLEAEPSDRAAG